MFQASMSLQSVAVFFPCTDSSIRNNTQWHRLSRAYPAVGLKWSRRRFVVTNAGPRRPEPRKEVLLDNNDLMALEFGRLLGEPKQKTLSKIVGKKIAPNASYVEIEKQSRSGKRFLNKANFTVKVDGGREKAPTGSQDLPRLASPPSRGTGVSVSAPPVRRPGRGRAGSRMEADESLDNTFLRKPSTTQYSMAAAVPSFETRKSEISEQFEGYQSSDHTGLSAVDYELNDSPEHTLDESLGVIHNENSDMAPVLPYLASPPSRNKGPIATSVQSAEGRTKAPLSSSSSSSIKSLANKTPDELLLSKLRSPTIKNAPSPPMQQPDDKSLESIEDALQYEQDSTPTLRLIASRPSRPKPSFGTSVQPARARTRPSQSTRIDEAVDETQLRRPSLSEMTKGVRVTSSSAEPIAEHPLPSTQAVLQIPSSNDGLDDLNSAKELEESLLSSLVNGALAPCEEFPQSKSSSALGGGNEAASELGDVSLSGGVLHQGQTSEKKSMKVAALKKPVRGSPMSSTEEEGSNNCHIDTKTDTGLERENDSSKIAKERESNEPPTPTAMVMDLPVQSLEKNEDRHHATQEYVTAASAERQSEVSLIDRATTVNHIEPDAKEASTNHGSVEQPMKTLRRPSLAAAELLGVNSQHIDMLHQAKEEEEKEWARAEALLESKEVVEVKLIGSNSAGLFVSFGCLVGFLPFFDLSPKRGLVDFTSWAQQKGHDLGKVRIGSSADAGQSGSVTGNSTMSGGELNELKEKYKEEVSKLMSSMVGERTRVLLKVVDKSRRKLKFSEKEADPDCQEHAQRKAKLMAELEIGDIVACKVKSITPIGAFVEVDGVSALIHRSEVSWNPTADPASFLSIGQLIKAKICRLDRTLQRINLSLKQMQMDPLKLTLESVVGDSHRDMCEMDAIDTKEEVIWPELEDLITKLQEMDDISCVSRGRCLYSAAFAPTFQVLISNPQTNGFKLLARFGNKIQEVLVDTTLDRERMKECIRLCTFSVAA